MRVTDFLEEIIDYCGGQFPKTCATCGKTFADLEAYFDGTDFVGEPTLMDTAPEDAIGLFSFANCRCGSTLCVECKDVDSAAYRALKEALRLDCAETSQSAKEILTGLRIALRERVTGRAAASRARAS